MITVNTSNLVNFDLGEGLPAGFLVIPTPMAALLDEPVVTRVGDASVELFLPVSDRYVRREGHEAVARAAQVSFVVEDQVYEVEAVYGSPVAEPGNSAWGLRVVLVRDEAGDLVSTIW